MSSLRILYRMRIHRETPLGYLIAHEELHRIQQTFKYSISGTCAFHITRVLEGVSRNTCAFHRQEQTANDRFHFPLISQICADKILKLICVHLRNPRENVFFARSIRSSPTGIASKPIFFST
jgi:hypothetical protein